ncbi:MAG: epimerase [Rickettsiales bacterium]|nr:epimerase [Rickettsiales bacterium]
MQSADGAARPTGERILVTGGAGFIGSAFAHELIEDNELVILDTFQRDSLRHWPGLREHPNLSVVEGSVLDEAAVSKAMDGATIVVHAAAVAGVDTVIAQPTRTMRVNIIGTWRVLEEAVKRGGIRRFVDFSTSEVFGTHAFRVSEGDVTSLGAVGEARWTYAVSKLATEHMAHTYHREFGLPTVALRPFNIYGPRQVGEGAVHHFIRRAIRDEPLQIHNDGAQIRAWCYIDDIVNALCRSLVLDGAVGQSLNIGNPRSTITIYNLAKQVVRVAGSGSAIDFIEWKHADVELRIPNVDKARSVLDFTAAVDLEEGLKKTIQWYREQDQEGRL